MERIDLFQRVRRAKPSAYPRPRHKDSSLGRLIVRLLKNSAPALPRPTRFGLSRKRLILILAHRKFQSCPNRLPRTMNSVSNQKRGSDEIQSSDCTFYGDRSTGAKQTAERGCPLCAMLCSPNWAANFLF